METTPFWMSTSFELSMLIYFTVSAITAILCFKESRKQHDYSNEWVLFGCIVPILPFLLLKGKR